MRKWRIKKVSKWLVGNRILDCGCGDGSLLDVISEDTYYVGIDVNEERIEKDKKRGRRNARFLLGDVEQDELKVGKFDVVVACALIEHLKNPKKFLLKISKLLSKNGRILITTPTVEADRILNLGSNIGIFDKEAYKEHRGYWGINEFKEVAKELNLTIYHYEKFQFGLNQLIVLSKGRK
ncbi:MAG: class I SAM-dependent methyltransferase [Candidatus Micrarchaeia archaeon]